MRRDEGTGTSRRDAEALASVVLRRTEAGIAVQPDGAHWMVHVDTSSAGVFTLYDGDWPWLQPQIGQGMHTRPVHGPPSSLLAFRRRSCRSSPWRPLGDTG